MQISSSKTISAESGLQVSTSIGEVICVSESTSTNAKKSTAKSPICKLKEGGAGDASPPVANTLLPSNENRQDERHDAKQNVDKLMSGHGANNDRTRLNPQPSNLLATSYSSSGGAAVVSSVAVNDAGAVGTGEKEKMRYGLIDLIRHVRKTNSMAQQEYNVLNIYLFIINIIICSAVFWGLYFLSIAGTKFFSPTSEKTNLIVAVSIAAFLITVQLLCVPGYCLLKREHPLVKARGAHYILAVLIPAFLVNVITLLMALIETRVIPLSNVTAINLLSTLRMQSVVMFVGAQVARQRLIYLLFVKRAFQRHSGSANRWSYACIFIWLIIVSVPVFIMLEIDYQKYRLAGELITLFAFTTLVLVLAYYSYRARNVQEAFYDMRSTFMAGVVVCFAPWFVIISNHTCFKPPPPFYFSFNIHHMMIRSFMIFITLAIAVNQLFGLMSIIVVANIKTADELDPKSLFTSALKKNSGPLPKAGTSSGLGNDKNGKGSILCAPNDSNVLHSCTTTESVIHAVRIVSPGVSG